MTAIIDRITGSTSTPTFDSLNPANGDVVGTYPIHSAEDVDAAVARARGEVAWWQGLGFDGRAVLLQQWKGVITRRIAQLAEIVHRETGKPHGDAQLEIALAIDHLDWAAKHAKKVLGRHKVPSGLLMANQASSVAYHPLGVVGDHRTVELPGVHARWARSSTRSRPATRWCSSRASTRPVSARGWPTP